jgi:two-component system, cell cycle sensor histidine kinase and response regulator CckA
MSPEEQIQRLAAFPRSNPNPVMEFDADGSMTYCNDAARHLATSFGADSVATILPPETRSLISACLTTGENVINLQTKVQKRTISWSFIPIAQSKTVHCYASDITDRLKLEAQLRYSVKMEAVGQLAAGVAHDFNNILTIIQGHADLLAHHPGLSPVQDKSARQITAAAERAGELIRQLLTFSRKQVMQQRFADLNEIIENLSPMLRGLVGETVTFAFDAAPNLPALLLDISMIEQAIVNLVLNARDAMPQGGKLTLTTSRLALEPVASVLNP